MMMTVKKSQIFPLCVDIKNFPAIMFGVTNK